jgi:hypothetical protein
MLYIKWENLASLMKIMYAVKKCDEFLKNRASMSQSYIQVIVS